jgi:hypothetical protein
MGSIKMCIMGLKKGEAVTYETYEKGDPPVLAAAHAAITDLPRSMAPAPPSAQWLATTASNAPDARHSSRTNASSASVSVPNLK